VNEEIGRLASWLVLATVLVGAFNALARYAGRFLGRSVASNAFLELQWYLYAATFLLAAAYTFRHNGHVRVDVVYSRFGPRFRTIVDLVGSVVFLLPMCAAIIVLSWPFVRESWRITEGSPDPGGLLRYPIKTMIPIGAGLLLLQGMAGIVRDVAILRGRIASEPEETPAVREGV